MRDDLKESARGNETLMIQQVPRAFPTIRNFVHGPHPVSSLTRCS